MSVRVIASLDAFTELIGEELGVSAWRDASQDRVTTFAEATEDRQWIHIDPARAASGPFGGAIAHGYLTLSMIPAFAAEVYRVENLAMVVNYGLNRVRFPHPVRVGARVRDHIRLVSVSHTPQGALAVTSHWIEIEGVDKPACVAETVSLLVTRAEGAG